MISIETRSTNLSRVVIRVIKVIKVIKVTKAIKIMKITKYLYLPIITHIYQQLPVNTYNYLQLH